MILRGEGFIHNFVWNKLYKKAVLTNIDFPNGKIYEDLFWTSRVIGNSKTILYLDSILYHYVLREDSLSHNKDSILRQQQDIIEMVSQRLKYICEKYPNLENLAVYNFQNICRGGYRRIGICNSQLDVDGVIRCEIVRRFRQAGFKYSLHFGGLKFKLAHLLFWFSPALYMKVSIISQKLYSLINHNSYMKTR